MKALLILVGGRPMPNMLTILREVPDVIVAITSQDKKDELRFLKTAIKTLIEHIKPNYIFAEDSKYIVDAFDLEKIKDTCKEAFLSHPDADWIFNITSATTVMSIGAYEVAKEYSEKIKCWYLDTAHTNVISLLPSLPRQSDEPWFTITVDQYLTACYCSLVDGDLEAYRTTHETQWLPFAHYLGRNPTLATYLKDIVRRVLTISGKEERQIDKNTPQSYQIPDLPSKSLEILEKAHYYGIISNWQKELSSCQFTLSEPQFKFLDGTWLEVYVWSEVKKEKIFSNIEWGKKISDRHGRKNQLDTALIYKAQLLVIECKTGKDAFQSYTFQTLESIANALGRSFVSKILVTSQSISNVEEVETRAKSSGISIIAIDDLPIVGQKIAEIAKKAIGS